MTRKRPTISVQPGDARMYLDNARGFRQTTEGIHSAGAEKAAARNSIAVIAVHAAIAYCDALTVRATGKKSKGDHRLASDFLAASLRMHSAEDDKAIAALRFLTGIKDQVSYAGEHVTAAEVTQILRRLTLFSEWAEQRFLALK